MPPLSAKPNNYLTAPRCCVIIPGVQKITINGARVFKRLAFVCFLFLLFPLSAFAKEDFFRPATPTELAMKDVPFASGVSAVILDWVRHRDDDASVEHEYLRIKILKDDAKKYADIELPYVPGLTRITGIKARTILPDGKIRDFDGKFYDKLIVKVYGTRVMNKTFTLPDAVPGSILEYQYTRQNIGGMLRNVSWPVQRELPVLHEKLSLRPYLMDVSVFFAVRGLPPGKRPVKTGPDLMMELENVVALPDEPFSPPSVLYSGNVLFYYLQLRQDPKEFWETYLRDVTRYIEGFSKESGLVKSTAAELVAGVSSEEAKLRKIYDRVQRLRNLTWEMEKSDQEERREKLADNDSVTDVLKRGYGYRSQLNRTFLALARSAGFDAQPVRGAQRDERFERELPDASDLEEFVAVNVGGTRRYFDPGTAFLPFGMLSWDNVAVMAVVIPKKQPAEWVVIPRLNSTDAVIERTADLRLEGESLVGTVRLTAKGHEGLSRRWTIAHSDEAEAKKTLEDDAKTWLPEGSTVKLTKISGAKSSDEPLVADFEVTVIGLGSSAGSRFVMPMSVFTSTRKNPFPSATRQTVIFFTHPYETIDRVTLKLPDEYAVDVLPHPTKLSNGDFQYVNDWKADPHSVTFTRHLTVAADTYSPEYYGAIRSFFARANTADQDALVLKEATPSKGGE
jgi:hypothetical protein